MPVTKRTTVPTSPKTGDAKPKVKAKSDLYLPSKANEPPTNFGDFVTVLYGEKGIGKTSLAAQFPDSLTFMFEPGRRQLRIKQVPQANEPPLNWERFVGYVDLLCEQGPGTGKHGSGFYSVNIDTIDRCYDCAVDWVCEQQGIGHPGEIKDYGKTWDLIKREFESQLNRLHFSGYGLIFTSHSRIQEIESHSGGESYNLVTPSCKNQAWNYLKAVADFAFYYGYGSNRQRIITLRGSELVWSACGTAEHFNAKDGRCIAELLVPDDPKQAYEVFMDAFENSVARSHCTVLKSEAEKAAEAKAQQEKVKDLKRK